MAGFIIRRLLYMIPMMFAISVVTFIIIQLPPGDFLTAMTARLASQNETIDPGVIAVRKSPGGSWMMMKVTTEIANIIGIMYSRRLMMKPAIFKLLQPAIADRIG